MEQVLLGLAILVASGFLSLLLSRNATLAARLALSGQILGSAVALGPVLRALAGGAAPALALSWSVPLGSLSLELDALSAVFAALILVLAPVAALQGHARILAGAAERSPGPQLFFQNLLAASMVLVVLARNGVLFLFAWEVMFLASFFLVTSRDDDESVREAGFTYLVATHVGTAFLFLAFVLLGSGLGSLDFEALAQNQRTSFSTGLAFAFALVGFGTKAGFVPLHVWLPRAYPIAPHHTTAVLSGAMSKLGIYGIARFLVLAGPPPAWWGFVLVGIGLSSGLMGILSALGQGDLKRFLGYSSVENVGVVALGLGVGAIGQASGLPTVALLGYGGALLHVLNHGMMKGLLFLAAGAIADATGTRDMEKLGGLLKRMPVTGTTFLVGAVAISALPPLNGFVSEFLIYVGAAKAAVAPGIAVAISGLAVLGGLALIGGLAAAAFARAVGIVLLGEPRTQEHSERARDGSLTETGPLVFLAAVCLALSLASPVVLQALGPALGILSRESADAVLASLGVVTGPLSWVVLGTYAFLVVVAILVAARLVLLSGRKVEAAGTWDCGYVKPTARIQYTASSFAQPLVQLFGPALRTKEISLLPSGILPREANHRTETPDAFGDEVYRPALGKLGTALVRLHGLQSGRLQAYVLYIALALLFLLVFEL